MKYLLALIFSCFLFTKTHAATNDTISINENVKQVVCDGKENYYFSIDEQPFQNAIRNRFQPKDSVNLQYITGWVWVKFIIKNNSDQKRYALTVSSGHVSGFYMYKPTPQGYMMTPPKLHHPEDGRELFNRLPSFFIDLEKGETKTFYMKVRAEDEVLHFSFVLRNIAYFTEYTQADYLIIGLYAGALLIIISVNFFYFISLKDPLFLIYAIYVFGNFLSTSVFDGFSWLLIPDTDFAYHFSFFSLRFWTDSLLFFTIKLVNLKTHNKVLSWIAYIFLFYHAIIMGVLELVNPYNMRLTIMGEWELSNCFISIIMVFVIIIISYKKNKYLFKYYVVGFGAILLAAMILPLYGLANSEKYLFLQHGIKVGSLIEMITLSFAVSRRFGLTETDLKRKKEIEIELNEKVKQLEMDVRKAQMNPHFMFNALTSIEYFILKNDSQNARNYLNKFAQLMRLTLENSRDNYIPLKEELNALKLYIELEFLRLKNHDHTFEIRVSNDINPEKIIVPALLIQPFVENAIWHGLQKKQVPGKLVVKIAFHEKDLICIVEDDGKGIDAIILQSGRKSSGITITKERLTLIHSILKTTNKFYLENIKNKQGDSIGTFVKFNLPYIEE